MEFSNFLYTLDPDIVAKGVSDKLIVGLPHDTADHISLTPYDLGLIAKLSVDVALELLEQYHDFITS